MQRDFDVSPVFGFWIMMYEVLQAFGDDLEIDGRLIGLLNSLEKLSDVTDKDGHPIKAGMGWSGIFWRDLSGLAVILRESAFVKQMLNLEKPKCQNEGDWTDAQAATPLRVTTFGALYLAHGTRDLGMPFHAEVSFMDGVEEAYQTPEEQKRARVNVPPTATWIFLAGEEIHELCRINYHRIADMSPYSKSLWKGGNGYSLERWA